MADFFPYLPEHSTKKTILSKFGYKQNYPYIYTIIKNIQMSDTKNQEKIIRKELMEEAEKLSAEWGNTGYIVINADGSLSATVWNQWKWENPRRPVIATVDGTHGWVIKDTHEYSGYVFDGDTYKVWYDAVYTDLKVPDKKINMRKITEVIPNAHPLGDIEFEKL